MQLPRRCLHVIPATSWYTTHCVKQVRAQGSEHHHRTGNSSRLLQCPDMLLLPAVSWHSGCSGAALWLEALPQFAVRQ